MKKVRDCKNITFNVAEQNITIHVKRPSMDIICEEGARIKSVYMGGYSGYYVLDFKELKWININSATARKLYKYLKYTIQDFNWDYYELNIKPFSK